MEGKGKLTSPFFLFLDDLMEKRTRSKSKKKTLATARAKWSSLSETEKARYVDEAAKRNAVYEHNKASCSEPQEIANDLSSQPPPRVDESKERHVLSAFGIFAHSGFLVKGIPVISVKDAFEKWNSLPARKSLYYKLATTRMKKHEKSSIAAYAETLGGVDDESDGSQGPECYEDASTGLMVFLVEFMKKCEEMGQKFYKGKSGKLLFEEQIQKWNKMTDEEKSPYNAKAVEIMRKYDEDIAEDFATLG